MKRSPLARTTSLARTAALVARSGLTARTSLSRSTPLDPSPSLPRTGRRDGKDNPQPKATEVPSSIRAKVYKRDDQSCVRCGKQLEAGNRQLQHRVPRGMGGRKDHARLSALILLCGSSATDPAGCHHHVESHRFDAQAGGWLVPMGSEPDEMPVLYADGVRYYLDDDGDRVAA